MQASSAVEGGSRIPLAPAVPTSTEAGYPKVRADDFSGLFGVKGLPDALRDRIAADVKVIADEKEVQELLGKSAQVPPGLPPAEFVKVLDNQRTSVAEMLGTLGMLRK